MTNNFDIIIVGAGILGTFSAYHALQQKKKVLLIESGHAPMGSTVRNFGQVVPSGLSLNGWRQLGIRSLEIYKNVAATANIDIQTNGSSYIASDDAESELLHELHELDRDSGYNSELFSQSRCLDQIPFLSKNYAKTGLFYKDEISIDSTIFLSQFLDSLKRHENFTLLTGRKVVTTEAVKGQTKARLSDGVEFFSKDILICCGYHLNTLLSNHLILPSINISKLQMLSTKPVEKNIIKGNILTGLTIRRYESFRSCKSYSSLKTPPQLQELTNAGIHLLFKQASNGEIIIGDSHHYFDSAESDSLDYGVNQDINKMILSEAHRIFPELPMPIGKTWNGYYSQESTQGVLAKTIENGIHIVTGIGGKGMTSGPALMEKVIDFILVERPLQVESLITNH